ncbi:MAG TPA: RNA polymerase sigma factor [Gemmatimonadales bacterium]|jgi:RNA polymerase sigma-70 factor (ECF subfamily)|nr:RNA polymerase sigma factor [Gemmatimonadales bacterium]
MDETDAELVHSVRQGDRRAAGRLLERYLRACRAVALAVTGVEADADDVCQEALVVAVERIDDCRDPSRFGNWLFQIVRNRARNLVRSPAVRRTVPLDDLAPAPGLSPAAEMERTELRERLLDALAEIPEAHREVVLLHDLEGWKHREIGERLGLPEGTVRSHLHHARRRLRQILGEGEVAHE